MDIHDTMNIVDLPTYAILYVLLYLPQEDIIRNVRLVCTRWYQLCEAACLWKKLRIRTANLGTRHTSPSFREFVQRVSDRVEELDIIAWKDDEGQPVEENGLDIANIRFPKLKSIVCASTLPSRFFNTFITHNSHVQYLDFQLGCEYDYVDSLQKIVSLEDNDFKGLFIHYINDDHRYRLADRLINRGHSLEKLILQDCNIGLDKIFNSLSRHPAFAYLDMCGCHIDSSCLQYTPRKTNMSLNSLVKVSILSGDTDDSVLGLLSTWAPRLKELHIYERTLKVTDTGISRLASNCPDLEIMRITALFPNDPGITDVGLTNIAKRCRLLRVLKLSLPCTVAVLTDAGIAAVAHSCPLLRELHVQSLQSFTDGVVRCPLTDGAIRNLTDSCPQLKVLNLDRCEYLTSQSVTDAVTRSCGLVRLRLENCFGIEDIILDGAEYRGKHSPGEDVRLNVSGVDLETVETETTALHADSELSTGTDHCKDDHISGKESAASKEESNDAVIKTYSSRLRLLENHYHLSALNLNGCYKLSDGCLIQISRHCPDLRELRIDGCPRVTDTGVSELVKMCELLTIFSFNMASRSSMSGLEVYDEGMLTDISMFNIARHCKYLQYLHVKNHHNITMDGIAAVAGGCPNIIKVHFILDS